MKRFFLSLIIFSITCSLFIHSSQASIPRYLRVLEKIKKKEPSFAQVVQRFYRNERITNSHFPKWEKKIKTAPLLPTLYFGYDHSTKESQDISINDNISLSSGTVTIGPEDHDYGYDSNLGHTIRARAVWRLDELVFNRNYFILYREKRDLAKVRTDLGHKVYKIYEQRYLLLMKYFQLRYSSPKKASLIYAKYLVLTDQLDSLTGGVFRKRWWKR